MALGFKNEVMSGFENGHSIQMTEIGLRVFKMRPGRTWKRLFANAARKKSC